MYEMVVDELDALLYCNIIFYAILYYFILCMLFYACYTILCCAMLAIREELENSITAGGIYPASG